MAEPPATQDSPVVTGPVSGWRSAAYLLLAAVLALLTGLALSAPAPVAKGLALTVFIVFVHVAMVALVPRTFPTMITGRLRRES